MEENDFKLIADIAEMISCYKLLSGIEENGFTEEQMAKLMFITKELKELIDQLRDQVNALKY